MMQIRPWKVEDVPALLAMNNAAVPAVSELDDGVLRNLLAWSSPTLVATESTGQPVAFIECLGPGLDYPSLNYRWFSERYEDFAYVDRIVVDASARSAGLGSQLYEALAVEVTAPVLLCEVNIHPPNPGSMRFHQRLGFAEVGRQQTDGGHKTVAMLAKMSRLGTH